MVRVHTPQHFLRFFAELRNAKSTPAFLRAFGPGKQKIGPRSSRSTALKPVCFFYLIFARFLPKMQEKTTFAVVDKSGFFYGRSEVTRTPGILLPKQARYQLRYTPIFNCNFIKEQLALLALLRCPKSFSAWSAERFRPLRHPRLAVSATGGASAAMPKGARYQLRYTPF